MRKTIALLNSKTTMYTGILTRTALGSPKNRIGEFVSKITVAW